MKVKLSTMTTLQQLILLQAQIYQTAKDKGFWDDAQDRNKGEMVMLIISELGECLEAHRSNNRLDMATRFRTGVENRTTTGWAFDIVDNNPEAFVNWFKAEAKDTVEDEMADVMIRILDYVQGWDIPLYEREYRKESTGNFGEDLLRLTHYTLSAYHNTAGKDWGYIVAAIIKFCEWYNIDLIQHMQWKMKYNSTRPPKHGKAY